jgi:hypothetical protein
MTPTTGTTTTAPAIPTLPDAFWDRLTTELILVVLLAFLIERALAVIFDMEKVEPTVSRLDLKPIIAMIVSVALCYGLKINVIAAMAKGAAPLGNLEWLGYAITGLIVAGGSAGAVKLFQEVLGFRRSLRDENKKTEQAKREAETLQAQALAQEAEAKIAKARADMVDSSAKIASTKGLAPEDLALEARIAMRELKIQRGIR